MLSYSKKKTLLINMPVFMGGMYVDQKFTKRAYQNNTCILHRQLQLVLYCTQSLCFSQFIITHFITSRDNADPIFDISLASWWLSKWLNYASCLSTLRNSTLLINFKVTLSMEEHAWFDGSGSKRPYCTQLPNQQYLGDIFAFTNLVLPALPHGIPIPGHQLP